MCLVLRRTDTILTIGVILGVAVCLLGAFLMVWGDPIFGEDHSGIASVVGIIGIGIITSSNRAALGTEQGEGL